MEDGIAGQVIRFDSDVQTISQFLQQWKPSSIPHPYVEWLIVSVRVADKTQFGVNTEGLLFAWDALCLSSLNRLTTADIESLAIKYGVLNGKWMYFLDNDQVDSQWYKISLDVVQGGLAIDVKVSTLHVKSTKSGLPKEEKIPNGQHVICIWSEDFTNSKELWELRSRLRTLGFTGKLYYKPNAYSICGIYQGNSLGLPAAKYCS